MFCSTYNETLIPRREAGRIEWVVCTDCGKDASLELGEWCTLVRTIYWLAVDLVAGLANLYEERCFAVKNPMFVDRGHNSKRIDLQWADKWYRCQIRINPHDPYFSHN